MKILAIETSCDDTGIAVLSAEGGPASGGEPIFDVLANEVSSQIELGKKYGGVFPAMAKREHQKNLVPTLVRALKKAKLLKPKTIALNLKQNQILDSILGREPELYKKLILFLKKYEKPDVDLIAVTNGPGLEPCLWVGINFARALSYIWNIPVVPVNHIESHILVNFLENKKIDLPALALVVSGGHTQLILVKKIPACRQAGAVYKILGETRDDAAGECFDKCAKIMGLPYPGGPAISKLAAAQIESGRASPLWGGKTFNIFPRPMINTKDYDFSFSGLKTAVLYAWQKEKIKNNKIKTLYAAEVQQAIIDVLLKKTLKAAKDFGVKSIILGGGVSANSELRGQFQESANNNNFALVFPPANLSTDNGLMTAIAGWFHAPASAKASARQAKKIGWQKLRADANLRIG